MKKLNILLLSALALGITTTSCSKDDDEKATSSVIGKWTINTYTITNSSGTSEVRQYDNPDCTEKSYWDLKQGNILKEQDVDVNNCDVKTYDGTYTFADKKLSIVGPMTMGDYTVVSIEPAKMIVSKVAGGQTYTYTLSK